MSPLFVRVANIEIEKNNPERAIEILSDGLLNYPVKELVSIVATNCP